MKRPKEIRRKILRKIYTGLGLTTVALVFQACYGTPPACNGTSGNDVLLRGTVKSKTTDAPIEGIKVSVKDMEQYELTNGAGKFQLYVQREDSYTILLEDIDGAENGSYSSKEISADTSETPIDILLDEAE